MFCKINSIPNDQIMFGQVMPPEDVGFIHLDGIPKENLKILCFGWGKIIRSLVWNALRSLKGNYDAGIIVVGRGIDDAYNLINDEGKTEVSILYPDKEDEKTTIDKIVGVVGSTAFTEEDTPHKESGKEALLRYASYDLDLIAVGITDKGFTDDSETLINLKEFLYKYYKHNDSRTITIINTDNVDHNGEEIKRIVKLHVKGDKKFEVWLDTNVDFKNSMIDHVIPDSGSPSSFSVEPYAHAKLYLTEGPPCRVPLEQSKDIKVSYLKKVDFETQIKLKLLIVNAIHTSMVPVAALSGFRYTNEAIGDPVIFEYLKAVFEEDIIKGIGALYPESVEEANEIFREWLVRLSNPKILHDLHWIGQNTFYKTMARLMPTVKANNGNISSYMALNLAAQLRFLTPYKEDKNLKQLVGYIDPEVKRTPRKFAREKDQGFYVFANGLYQFAEKKEVTHYIKLLDKAFNDHSKTESSLGHIFDKWGMGGAEYERARKKTIKAYQQLLTNNIRDVLARVF